MYLRVKGIDFTSFCDLSIELPNHFICIDYFQFFFYEISPMYEINRSTFVVTCFRGIIDNYSVPRN